MLRTLPSGSRTVTFVPFDSCKLTVGHDGLAALEPSVDHRPTVDDARDLDRPHLRDAVLDDEHEGAGLAHLHGDRRAPPRPPRRAGSTAR